MRSAAAGLLCIALAGCGSDPDRDAERACELLGETMRAIRDSELDFDQIRAGVAEVRTAAEASTDDDIKVLAQQLADALETSYADDFIAAAQLLGSECDDLG